MPTSLMIIVRGLSTSSSLFGKRNFRKFILPRRGSNIYKEMQKNNPEAEMPFHNYGVREVGCRVGDQYVVIPERIPELVVPDLTDFQLKPYVSYRVPDVMQSEFTAEDLFNAVYSEKIRKDFKAGELDKDGNPLKPSDEEKLTPDQAWIQARKTGSDIFAERSKREEEEKYDI